MMRVEVNMSKPFRGFIEHYSDKAECTMPQAYRELLIIGLVCCDADIENLPIDDEEVQELISDKIDLEELN